MYGNCCFGGIAERSDTRGSECARYKRVEESEENASREDFLANFGQACKELKQNLEGKLEF